MIDLIYLCFRVIYLLPFLFLELDQLTGIAAILRFPMEDIDDEMDDVEDQLEKMNV